MSIDMHHCNRCQAEWPGIVKAHCNVCHETFVSNGVADLHWSKRGHRHPSELPGRLRQDEAGFWHSAKRRQSGTIPVSGGARIDETELSA